MDGGRREDRRPIAEPAQLRAVHSDRTPRVDLAALTSALEGRRRLIYLSVLGELGERVAPRVRKSPSLWAPLSAQAAAVLDEALRGFRSGAVPEDGRVSARYAARLAIASPELEPALLELPRVVHMALWDTWLELVETNADDAGRSELLRRGSDYLFAYSDQLSRRTADARRGGPTREDGPNRLLAAVTAVLDDEPGAAEALDYDLERHHFGLVAWGGGDPGAPARELAALLERPLLCVMVPGPEASCWAWISGTRPLGGAEEHRLAEFEPTAAGRLALGLEGFGAAGFRAAHRQALRARRFAPAEGGALARYEDVVVESLAAENEADARAFVAHELRGIEDDSSASRRLRETLEAYFGAEYNAASAAARLGVHQQTVANRLRTVEERLGRRSVGARRVELEVALRLRARLDGPSSADAA